RLPQGSALPYRPCVGVALFNRDGQVFIGRRKREAGPEHVEGDRAWQMPQGGIDDGEAPIDAAIRELREETGVQADKVRL
ncbi:RNA pyrophosphohydrolase, partial [Rhodococcus erythropolis]